MLLNLTAPQISFFVILIVAFALLLTERLRNDLVAILIVLSLYITGVLDAEEALAGFSSEPAIVVAAIFVLSAGLHQTGLSETAGGWVGRLAGGGYARVLGVLMPSVALLSAFTHHLTTTAMMLPVTLNLSRERNIAPSKLLMPLSFAASLGTTITIIGAPAFIIASGVLQQAGRPGLGIFSIAPIGLVLSVVGTLFMLLAGRLLLPDRGGGEDSVGHFRLDDYFTEVTILPNSPFLDMTVGEVRTDERYRLNVVGLVRNGHTLRRPLGRRRLRVGDVLLVRASPDQLVEFRQEQGVELHPISKYGGEPTAHSEQDEDVAGQLVQAVVAPNSELIGRTIGEIDFRQRFGVIVVSLWRREGWLDRQLVEIDLFPGDVLVLQGDADALARVQNDPGFLMMVPFQGEQRLRRKARLAGAIMLATVLLAAFNVLSIEMAAVAGAVAMVMSHCLTSRQAYRHRCPHLRLYRGCPAAWGGHAKKRCFRLDRGLAAEYGWRFESDGHSADHFRDRRGADTVHVGCRHNRRLRPSSRRACNRSRSLARSVRRYRCDGGGRLVPDADRPPRQLAGLRPRPLSVCRFRVGGYAVDGARGHNRRGDGAHAVASVETALQRRSLVVLAHDLEVGTIMLPAATAARSEARRCRATAAAARRLGPSLDGPMVSQWRTGCRPRR